MSTQDLAFRAMMFAREAHKGQKRKYTGLPYATHLAEVAGLVAGVVPAFPIENRGQEMIAVAWLHDYIEDINPQEGNKYPGGWWALQDEFGTDIAYSVLTLSDREIGTRAERKIASNKRLANASGWIQTIKVADIISNTTNIRVNDPQFAEKYLAEKRAQLDVLTLADARLIEIARAQVDAR